jgi:quercetin dioxygenase-like cupin family protein
MRKFKIGLCFAAALLCLIVVTIAAQTAAPPAAATPGLPMNMRYQDIKWQKMQPDLGDKASEITILRVDSKTNATHLLIRVPKNFHVPKHFHTANETHTVVQGTFIVECDGKRESLTQGSWNYVPSKMVHEAWTKPDEGALLFITVDSGWDINFVGGPPKASDWIGGRKN